MEEGTSTCRSKGKKGSKVVKLVGGWRLDRDRKEAAIIGLAGRTERKGGRYDTLNF
jgi:hypothetical protein